MRLLVTGGCGFIGSNFIRYWLTKHPGDWIVNLDKLTYAGRPENTSDFSQATHYRFIKGDICDLDTVKKAVRGMEVVVNFAAESHNDRGVRNPGIFIRTNVLGTQVLLEAARKAKVTRFHQISTCEVFGDLGLKEKRAFRESDSFRPRTPYNASKAAANHVVMAYFHTFGLPVTISHCSNNFGPYQFPEKIIPRFVTHLIDDQPIPLFKSSLNRREWIYVDDHNAAVDLIIHKGRVGESYNIGSGTEKSIEEIADGILKIMHKSGNYKEYVPDRPGHDRRYLLDTSKIRRQLKWHPQHGFASSLTATVKWYQQNSWWWRPLKKRAESIYPGKI